MGVSNRPNPPYGPSIVITGVGMPLAVLGVNKLPSGRDHRSTGLPSNSLTVSSTPDNTPHAHPLGRLCVVTSPSTLALSLFSFFRISRVLWKYMSLVFPLRMSCSVAMLKRGKVGPPLVWGFYIR